jgi:type VI secretion system protein ImpC
MSMQDTAPKKSSTRETVALEHDNSYERLCELVDISPLNQSIKLNSFADASRMADISLQERLTAGIQVFLDLATRNNARIERIDKTLLDQYIAQIDQTIGSQLDVILHHPDFQKMESSWRGLQFMVDRCDFRCNTKVEILDCSKEDLLEDFEEAPEIIQTGLYKHVYVSEYDTPGGQPFSNIVANFEFDSSAQDVTLLREASKVSASAHCPFLASVGAKFFGKSSVEEIAKINDLSNYMEKAEFTRWRSFRDTEDSRYVGLRPGHHSGPHLQLRRKRQRRGPPQLPVRQPGLLLRRQHRPELRQARLGRQHPRAGSRRKSGKSAGAPSRQRQGHADQDAH